MIQTSLLYTASSPGLIGGPENLVTKIHWLICSLMGFYKYTILPLGFQEDLGSLICLVESRKTLRNIFRALAIVTIMGHQET